MTITDLYSRRRIASRVFLKRVKGIDGLITYTDKEIWLPKVGETLMVVAAWAICMKQRGSRVDSNNFELEINNVDVVASVSGPNTVGATQRLTIASQTTFTNSLPLTFTATDAGTGDVLEQDLILIAIKI